MDPIQFVVLDFIYKHVDERNSKVGKCEMQGTDDEIKPVNITFGQII